MRRGQESVLQMKPKYGIGARRRQPARPQYIKGLFWSKATLIPIQRITAAGNRAIRAEGALGSGSTDDALADWFVAIRDFAAPGAVCGTGAGCGTLEVALGLRNIDRQDILTGLWPTRITIGRMARNGATVVPLRMLRRCQRRWRAMAV